jgi:hypothetical protein
MEKHAIYQLTWSTRPTGPSELGTWTVSYQGEIGKIQLSQLEEWREKAYHSAMIYKDRTKRWHAKRIRPKAFKAGDNILLFNSRWSSSSMENYTANG